MSGDNDNDDENPPMLPPVAPERQGEAALLLIESLIHGLLARSGLTIKEAVEIVQGAIDVQIELSLERGDNAHGAALSTVSLSAIAASLQIDDQISN